MEVDVTDIAAFCVLSLASGRVAFCLTKDDIFQGMREWIWMRSAPEDGMVLTRTSEGDLTRPARAYHRAPGDSGFAYYPGEPFREPAFFGQLFECPYCMSFWTSLIAFAAWMALGSVVIFPALPLAIWMVANLLAVKGLL